MSARNAVARVASDATALSVAYERAKTAIAELMAIPVDELVDVGDAVQVERTAELIAVTARQAKDRQMEIDAVEIRMRAERRLGQMLAAKKGAGGLNAGTRGQLRGRGVIGGSDPVPPKAKLAELGIDKKLSASSQQLAQIPATAFEEKLGNWRKRLEGGTERVSRAIGRDETKGERRAGREAELAGKIRALPAKRYGVICADPEWRFEPRSRVTGLDRSADNHYPTSSTDEIAMRPVDEIAADDCVLFLWATAPMLEHALRVMAAWGFAYKSQVIWRKAEIVGSSPAAIAGKGFIQHGGKVVLGTGYWFRNAHELLLVGTRGDVPAPAAGTQWPSIVDAAPLKHSEKPAVFYELIEGYFPTLPKIELNARTARAGWDAWGNEAPAADPHDALMAAWPGDVPVLVRPGDVVTTSYRTGPYRVLAVTGPYKQRGGRTWSLTLCDPAQKGAKATAWINDLRAVDGGLVAVNGDKVFVNKIAGVRTPVDGGDRLAPTRPARQRKAAAPAGNPKPRGWRALQAAKRGRAARAGK